MGSGSNPVGEYECIDVRWSDPDGVEHADVSQFTERAEPVHRLGAYVEVYSDLVDRQQRPQPVRRILSERCENLRIPGIRARLIPSSGERLRSAATRWNRLVRPSKPLVGGSNPSGRATNRAKEGHKIACANPRPLSDVRRLSATGEPAHVETANATREIRPPLAFHRGATEAVVIGVRGCPDVLQL